MGFKIFLVFFLTSLFCSYSMFLWFIKIIICFRSVFVACVELFSILCCFTKMWGVFLAVFWQTCFFISRSNYVFCVSKNRLWFLKCFFVPVERNKLTLKMVYSPVKSCDYNTFCVIVSLFQLVTNFSLLEKNSSYVLSVLSCCWVKMGGLFSGF